MRISAAPSPSSATTRRSGRASARPKRQRRHAAHRADHVELIRAVVDRVEFAAAETRSTPARPSSPAGVCAITSLQCVVPRRARVAPRDGAELRHAAHRRRRAPLDAGLRQRVRRDAALLHHERVRTAGRVHVRDRAIERRPDRVGFGRKQSPTESPWCRASPA